MPIFTNLESRGKGLGRIYFHEYSVMITTLPHHTGSEDPSASCMGTESVGGIVYREAISKLLASRSIW